jgi:glycosyltransferase involved in cell wall biosynthesis
MRIGIDVRPLVQPALKGIGVYLANLLPALAAAGGENQFVLLYDKRQDIALRLPEGGCFEARGSSVRKGDRFYFWEQIRLPLEVRGARIDLLHSAANTTCLFRTGPTVVTIHDTKALELSTGRLYGDLYNRTLQPYALRRADRIICDSEFTRKCLLERVSVDPETVHVVHLGISDRFRHSPDASASESTLRRLGITEEFILFAGGESSPKNISNLLRAFAVIKERTDNPVSLVVPGIRTASILHKHQDEARAAGISESTIFPGYVDDDTLVHLYNRAVLLAYPSLWEGFGFPPLEAMACGLPVAASNATSVPEVVGNAAVLFDGTNPMEMADAIQRVLVDHNLRMELRQRGFQRASQFQWSKTAERTLAVYEAAMSSRLAESQPLRGISACK